MLTMILKMTGLVALYILLTVFIFLRTRDKELKGAADQFDDITMLAFVYKEIRGLNLLFVVSTTYWQNHFEIMPI